MELLKVTCTAQSDRVVIALCGEIDMATAERLQAELVEAMVDRIERGAAPVLEVDMSQVSFMDCSGLDLLISFRQSLLCMGGDLRLVNVPARVDRLLDCLGLNHLLEDQPRLDNYAQR